MGTTLRLKLKLETSKLICVAMCIALVECVALCNGIDGVMLTFSIGALCGLVGYKIDAIKSLLKLK